MKLGGYLSLKAPGLKKCELEPNDPRNDPELIFYLDDGKKVEFNKVDVYVDVSGDKNVHLKDSSDDECVLLSGSYHFGFENEKEESAGLTISIDQARKLKRMLELYIQAYDSYKGLLKETEKSV